MDHLESKTAFVFTGGGSLGAVQVGMLRALLNAGERPDFVVGASVGALNAAYFAGDPTLDGVSRLAELWRGIRRADVFPVTLGAVLRLLWRPDSIVSAAGLRALIDANLVFAQIEEARLPLHVAATDMGGLDVLISQGPATDAILASAAIPGVFPMVEIDGRPLMDGAIAAKSTVRVAAELGARRIIVLHTGYACALESAPKGAIASALHAITLLVSWRLMRDLETLPPDIGVHVAPTLCPLSISPFNFSESVELIERATISTRKWIDTGGLQERSRPQQLAAHSH